MIEIIAEMPGKVIKILINEGDSVMEDQELMILEAMKMEIPIYAPNAGIVKEIKIKVGDKVKEDDVLIVLK